MLERRGLRATYLSFELRSFQDPENALKEIISEAEVIPDIVGFKLAAPYKRAVFRILETYAEGAAARLGVANTVVKKKGRFFCENTDGEGMYHNLLEAFGPLKGKTFLIVGAGGAATTISDRLIQTAGRIVIANRTLKKAHLLKQLLNENHNGKTVEVVSMGDIPRVIQEVDCVINTTPVGREGPLASFSSLSQTDVSADENNKASEEMINTLSRPIWFASTLYRPEKELLLRQAEKGGHRIVNGLGMWCYQAACAAKEFFFLDELLSVPLHEIATLFREGLNLKKHENKRHPSFIRE